MTSTLYTDPTPNDLLASRPSLRMDPRDGLLFEDVPVEHIARELGTPCWITGAGTLRRRAADLKAAFTARDLPMSFHFAMKAQDHQATLRILKDCGYGVDIVSGGEMARALAAGIAPEAIVFSGVGKSDQELRAAIAARIGQINVESVEELYRLAALAEEAPSSDGFRIRVTLRVNPDVDAQTHDKISTGRADDKFGIAYDQALSLYVEAQKFRAIHVIGLAVHLGSQMLAAEPFRRGYERLAEMVRALRSQGQTVEIVDCGGGLGISYRDEIAPAPDMLAGVIAETLGGLDVTIGLEPGRWLAAPTGLFITRVIETKAGNPARGTPDFLIVDGGMNDLARPAMYDSWHGIVPVSPTLAHDTLKPWHVVGPVCESSDVFARNRPLPTKLQRGDLVAFLDAGAYGSVMSSTYNSRPFVAQALVDNGRWSCIRKRQSIAELIAAETLPDWL
ncbi:diaminopimelate decarboxylase [Neokomagataea thailandica NBRC 106555]|uniref:Diaminopimelate decarboxylase n=2 Tax=Neokomagataea TaxID=1223423 RepID=A0A4Y6V4W1_9PROT|nr:MULTISPECIES: diaminopimelate decarboxylase [Neokomagataea]QDH24963.1 diaminopimelate decarboxylase [Neokomagataea tanensis]GBR51612.1 diaminopimelate decarboxylase [Neokomagataea thailandica NBRC 106555]